MREETEVLLRLCEESWNHIRHLEDQRATFTNVVIAVAAGVLGFVVPQGLSLELLPLTALLFVLGATGAVATWKFYERFQWHKRKADEWLDQISTDLLPNANIRGLENIAREKHSERYPVIHRRHVHELWIVLHGLVAILGLLITLVILF